jgi:hypothetical protein
MSATIKVFYVGTKCFKHVMSSYHDCVELRDEEDKILLTYSDGAKVFDQRGRLGNFNIDFFNGRPCWIYCEAPLEACIALGPDLPTAEVEVSKRYIRQLEAMAF